MDAVGSFASTLAAELGVEFNTDVETLLDVAKDVAHGVARPATPVATYVMGLAAAGGADTATIAAGVQSAIAKWQAAQPDS